MVVSAVQPGFGCTDTNDNGWLSGSLTSSETVEASGRSFGTLSVTIEKPPFTPGSGIVTCAPAGATPSAIASATTTNATTGRTTRI